MLLPRAPPLDFLAVQRWPIRARFRGMKHEINAAPPGLLDEDALLQRLPVSRRTLHSWRTKGLLPYVRPPGGRRVLYHWPSVESALLRLQRGGQ